MAHFPNTSISLRVLARLLSYPDRALRDDLDDMRAALLVEQALTAARKDELYALMHHLKAGNPLENESDFIELFDRGHSTSLHLFEHVHGDSRDRGPAMVDLVQTYEKAGLFLAPGELPVPIPGQTPAPEYPPAAMRSGDQGTVLVRVEVGADGVPTSVEVAQRSGSRDLDRAAVNAVRQWRFQPAQRDGQAVAGAVTVPIDFKMR